MTVGVALMLSLAMQTPPALATISGRVLETGTDHGVRRAIVTLAGSGLPNGKSAVTDDDGRFVIGGVPDGDFVVSATRPGYLKAAFGASRPGRAGTSVAIRGGASRSDIMIAMTHGSALAGTVRDLAGDPASGMRVEAIRIQHAANGDRAEKLGEAFADDRGEFRIFGLPAGDYVLAATPRLITGGLGDIGAPSESDIDAVLNALRGRTALPSPGSKPATSPALPNRGYATPAIFYPGVISPTDAITVALGTNDAREGLDFGTRLSHAATVDGTVVTPAGVTASQLRLELQTSGPQLPVAGGSLGRGPSVRMDNSNRTFQITNATPGHYRLNARTLNAPGANTQVMSSGGGLPQIDTNGPVLWGSVEFDVIGDDITGLTLPVQPAPTVAGRVGIDPAAAQPLKTFAGVRISLLPMPETDARANGLTAPITAAVAADGSFQLRAVIPGAYRVSAALPSGWWLRSAGTNSTNSQDVLDGLLTIDANGLSDLALTVSDRHSGVGGTLVTAGGPATDYFLVAFTVDKSLWRAPSRRVRSARPSTSGAFDIDDLPAGEYYLAALSDLDVADLEDPTFLEALIPAAATITIEEGRRTVQDLRIGGYN